MNNLIDPLKNLGLTEKEAKVYLALLQLGPSTPYEIAKKAEIKRPTAYVIAEELVEKGFIAHVPGEERKQYIARTPEGLVEESESKLQAVKKILPELKSFQKGTSEQPSILYFEGVTGLRQAYQYKQKELHNKEIVGFFASPDDATPEVLKVFHEWNEYKERHNTKVRGLSPQNVLALKQFEKFFNQETTAIDAKFLPPNMYNAKVSIESCDSQFVRICLVESAQTLIIESPKFAFALKQVFEMLWKSIPLIFDPNPHKSISED